MRRAALFLIVLFSAAVSHGATRFWSEAGKWEVPAGSTSSSSGGGITAVNGGTGISAVSAGSTVTVSLNGTLPAGSTQYINNTANLTQSSASIVALAISTNVVPGVLLNVKPKASTYARRLALDMEGTSTNQILLEEYFRANHSFIGDGDVATLKYDGSGNGLSLATPAGKAISYQDFDDGSTTFGNVLFGNSTIGNALQMNSSLGTASFSISGSTVIQRSLAPNNTDNAWLYLINASTANATVRLEATDLTAFISGRLHRVCKVDASTNTVTVSNNVGTGNTTTLSFVNECVDYYNLPSGGASAGVWQPIGILKSTSTPAGSGGGGGGSVMFRVGGSDIVATSTANFNGSQFVGSNVGGVATYDLNSGSVTLKGNETNVANGLVVLDGSGRLPAVDGSQLTGLPSGSGSINVVTSTVSFGTNGDELASVTITGQTWVTANSAIVCTPTMFASSTRDEGAEDAVIEHLSIAVHSRIAGTGFTVVATTQFGYAYGDFIIQCIGG